MNAADYEVVSNLSPELSKQAALANFDISNPAWHYQQIVCPAFPDYVFLAFTHGADESGSSRFAAMLPRNSAQVRIVSTYAHGLLPFEASWNRPGTFEVFNGMLRQERGTTPLSHARNWLMIAVCYAELSGYPVQVLNYTPRPGSEPRSVAPGREPAANDDRERSERRCHLQRRLPAHHHHQLESPFRSPRPDHLRGQKPGAPVSYHCAEALRDAAYETTRAPLRGSSPS